MTQNISNKKTMHLLKELDSSKSAEALCFYCLSTERTLICLSSCKHITFLEKLFKNKLNLRSMLLCTECHHLLKKTDLFLKRVEQCCSILQGKTSQFKKVLNYTYSTLLLFSTLNNELCEVKIEPEDVEVKEVVAENTPEVNDFYNETAEFPELQAQGCEEMKEDGWNLELVGGREEMKKDGWILELVGGIRLMVIELSDAELGAERERAIRDPRYTKKSYKCQKCIISYDHAINLDRHLTLSHNENNAHVCDVCECTYDTESKVRTHTKRHYLRYKCMECDKLYQDKQTAVVHYKEAHTVNRKIYRCDLSHCRFETASHRSYKYHQAKHNQVKCSLCDGMYLQGTQLRMHIKYVCDDCSKRYSTKRFLRQHIETAHLKLKPDYKCTICDKIFNTSFTLRRHVEFKHEKKKLPRDKICEHCGRGFMTNKILSSHIRTHTGERPYVCQLCGATFGHSGAMYTHKRLLHGLKKRKGS
uniref:C2H2-type domain-containing protein n=1 Tax=Bombyx mori TaxID=7091 RepID=A0A8R2DM95_BOMMO|nr:zinc finger protein 57 isoform X3 [Bombyx mori]